MKISSPVHVQRGAALVTVLVLLLVMTLLGLVGLRTTLLEERMSANLYDRSLAFQAAEFALREGMNAASLRPTGTAGSCAAGVCGFPDPAAAPVWTVEGNWTGAPAVAGSFPGGLAAPQYIVELLANSVPPRGTCTTSIDISAGACTGTESRYRVTARSRDASGTRASVMLQSIVAVP